jgi:hypothetical protein
VLAGHTHLTAMIHWNDAGEQGDFSAWEGRSDTPLPHFLDRTLASAPTPVWDYRDWLPDVVCVGGAIGLNDYATPIRPRYVL